MITVDESGTNLLLLETLNAESDIPIGIRQNKYLNKVIERDHTAIKRIIWRPMGF